MIAGKLFEKSFPAPFKNFPNKGIFYQLRYICRKRSASNSVNALNGAFTLNDVCPYGQMMLPAAVMLTA